MILCNRRITTQCDVRINELMICEISLFGYLYNSFLHFYWEEEFPFLDLCNGMGQSNPVSDISRDCNFCDGVLGVVVFVNVCCLINRKIPEKDISTDGTRGNEDDLSNRLIYIACGWLTGPVLHLNV